MSAQIPLGRSEDQRLEFKSREVLRHLSSVGREAVAMLNTDRGGDIWIGLAEEDGRAMRVEPIENASREAGRLRDHFSDAIEPSPTPGEIEIDQVEDGRGGVVLRLRVRPSPARWPRALREGAGRQFLKRVADRVRPMSYEEVFSVHKSAKKEDLADRGKQALLNARDLRLKESGGRLWLRIQPIEDLNLELSDDFPKVLHQPHCDRKSSCGLELRQRIRRNKA